MKITMPSQSAHTVLLARLHLIVLLLSSPLCLLVLTVVCYCRQSRCSVLLLPNRRVLLRPINNIYQLITISFQDYYALLFMCDLNKKLSKIVM